MSQEQAVRIAQKLLVEMGSGAEPDEIAALFSTDVQFEVRDDVGAFPWIGRRSGREAVSDFIHCTRSLIERIRFDVNGILANEDWAVIFGDLASKVNATGRIIESPCALILHVITLMDVRLPGINGTDALISIRGEFPDARIIILTSSDGDAEINRAMRAGAAGYALKSMPKHELVALIRSVHAGRRHVPPDVASRLAEHLGEESLTARELEVLRLIQDGHRNKQIADELV